MLEVKPRLLYMVVKGMHVFRTDEILRVQAVYTLFLNGYYCSLYK